LARSIRPTPCTCSSGDFHPASSSSEARIFDKAETAGQREDLKKQRKQLRSDAQELKAKLTSAELAERDAITQELTRVNARMARLQTTRESIEEKLND
jgi:hypothetical protein